MPRHHKLSLLLLVAGSLAQASQSLSAGSGAGVIPNSAPFTSLSGFRIEFRIHGPWSIATTQVIYSSNSFDVRTIFGGLTLTSWSDGSTICTVSPAIGTDVTIRLQRLSSVQLTAEAFDNQTGANLGSNTCSVPVSSGTPTDGGSNFQVGTFNGNISYIRAFQATVALGTPPGNTTCAGDLLDFEFEGNGNDCSGRGINMTMTGASYTATPALSPAARFNVWPTLSTTRAGAGSLQLTSSSFTSNDNATISYFWQQLGGPITGTFSSRTAASPTFAAPLAGTYTIQLSACDSTGQCATPAAVPAGAVSTDSKAVVVTGLPPAMDNLLGPLVIANAAANPWPYGDLAEIGTGANVATTALSSTPQLGTQLPGTVSWVPGNIVTTTSDLRTPLTGQSYLAIAWDSSDGPGTGRIICPISGVSATQVTCQTNIFAPGGSGQNAYLMPPTGSNGLNFLAWLNGNPPTVWNYYDVGIGLYRLYYRTGNNAFQAQARQFADIQWQWMIDHGYNFTYPRAASMVSQYFRALEGHSERFPGLYNEVTNLVRLFGDPSASPNIDNREAGYTLWDVALGAKTDTDPTRHAQYCSWLSTYVPVWNSVQSADGSWGENEYSNNPSYVSAPKSFTPPFTYEGAPWREAINLKAMQAAYESLNDTSSPGCNSVGLAASALAVIKKAEAWVVNYGRDSIDRGHYYEVNSQSSDQATVFNPAGSVAISVGSKTLSGTGTGWMTAGYCDGLHFVGIQTPRTVYKISSCLSDTSATLSLAFGLYGETVNVSGSPYSIAPSPSNVCNSLATFCFDSTGDRNLTRTGCGSMGWLYFTTGISMYKDWGDECYSATLGGPATGPGSGTFIGAFATTCAGPACDGFIGDVVAGAPDCNAGNPAPCVPGSYVLANLGKNFGEAFGAPGIDNHLGWRLGGLAPAVNRTLWVSFRTAGVPQATQARITLTQPSGVTVTQTCSASPCAVQADARQGNHVAQVVYLSGSGQTLASGDPMVVVVQ